MPWMLGGRLWNWSLGIFPSGSVSYGLSVLLGFTKNRSEWRKSFGSSGSDSADGYFYCGDALLQLGRVAEAIPLLEEAVRLSNSDFRMRASLSTAYLSAGRGSEAIPHIEAALQGEENERLLFQLSRAYQAAGRPEDARVALARRGAAIASRPASQPPNEITAP